MSGGEPRHQSSFAARADTNQKKRPCLAAPPARQLLGLASCFLLALLVLAPLLSARAADTDGDGMPDSYELAHPCLNVNVPDGSLDPDNDTMTSLQEYQYSPSLDPCSPDTDGDGLPDGWEVQHQTCGFDPVSNTSELVPAKIGADLRITNDPGESIHPHLSWTGSEYGEIWEDNRDGNWEIYFARVSRDGMKIGADLRVTNSPGGVGVSSLSWTGSEYGVIWGDDRDGNMEIYFARVSPEGVKIGADIRVTSDPSASYQPSLSWTGSEYGVIWEDDRDASYEIYFARLSPEGIRIGAELQVADFPAWTVFPSLSWTGSEFGISWADGRDFDWGIYFTRVSAAGAKIGNDIRVTTPPSYSSFSSLSWSGSEFGVSWQDLDNNEIYFARLSASGEKIGPDLLVNSDLYWGYSPSLSWTGTEFGIMWLEDLSSDVEIRFARISSAGAKIGDDLRVSGDAYDGQDSLCWTGSGFGLTWVDQQDGNEEIYFARVGIQYVDKDGDGLRDDREYALGTDPCIPDTDGDGLSDGAEVNTYGTNPLVPDTDGDGMPDGWEAAHGLNPLVNDSSEDSDNDGLTNLEEYLLGTDPCNVESDGDGLPDGWEAQYQSCGFDPSSYWSEVYGKIGADLRVSNAPSDSIRPSPVWSGSEFGMSWVDYRNGNTEIYFARVSATGSILGDELRVTGGARVSGVSSLSWTGSEFGVSWTDYRDGNKEIYFARISAAGAKIGADLRITTNASYSQNPSLSWSGSEFGVSWQDNRDGNDEIYFARVSASGAKIGADLRVTNDPGESAVPSLTWTGSEFGVGWADLRNDLDGVCKVYAGTKDCNYEIYFSRVSAAGAKIGADLRITTDPSDSQYPKLSWAGSEFAVSWWDGRSGGDKFYFTLLSAGGAKIGADLQVVDSPGTIYALSLLWTGSEFGVIWQGTRDGNYEIYFTRVSTGGARIGAELRVTSDPADSSSPALSWTGSEFGLSWQDTRDGNAEIYFTRIGAGEYTDKDGDGLSEDQEYAAGTNPCVADSDGDGLTDGEEVLTYHTNPLLADSDGDGLSDYAEVMTYHTNPLSWDSDGDQLPDKFEVDKGGHAGGGLDPINALDGAADFDGDGNSNANEYWNGSDPWVKDPVPGRYANPGCYYWGDADGDGIPAPSDVVKLRLEIAGVAQAYRDILPHGTDTMDLDRDGYAAPSDGVLLALMVAGSERPGGYPSQAGALEVVSAPTGSVAAGSTTHVTVSVHSVSGAVPYASGFGVVFEVVSGNAVLLGGDGTAEGEAAGNRYDISMEAAAGARANMVVLVTGPGPVTIGAKVPACGTYPYGRWNDEITLTPAVVINGP